MENNIIVIAEHFEGKIRSVTYELIGLARMLGEMVSSPVKVVILGHGVESMADELAGKTGSDVLCGELSHSEVYNSQIYKSVIPGLIKALNPSYICVGHTSMGIDFAPGLAVKLSASCVTAVNGVKKKNRIMFSHPIANGKINAWLRPDATPCVLTVQPGTFSLNAGTDAEDGVSGRVTAKPVSYGKLNIKNQGVSRTVDGISDLQDAKIIVAAGRGIGEEENLKKIEHFASLFPGAKVAGSRPLIDMGWMAYRQQVGITGAVVSPDLYIACGISGSSQHIAGMGSSKFIVAVNNDKDAAIFNIADVCIHADVIQFIDVFEKRLKKNKE